MANMVETDPKHRVRAILGPGCKTEDEAVNLQELLDDLASSTKEEFKSMPEVVDGGDDIDVGTLPIKARKWVKVDDVVVVVADLKNSTKLGTGSKAPSTASIYQAATGGVVKILDEFDADFIQIQGDGAFAIFWGDRRYERAACAGITVKTNSIDLCEQIEAKWPSKPETGFKVGIASGRVLVKRVGTPRNPAQQEPVWAGKPVNYASKAAQCADRHLMIVTGSVWDHFEKNDYLTFSCTCSEPSDSIWDDVTIDRLPEDDPEAQGRLLKAKWCTFHGEDYCDAILDGKKNRPEVNNLREAMLLSQMRDAIRVKASQERRDRRAHLTGLGA
jgi:class 3 adenylate cyclase